MDERDLHYLKKETKLNGRYIITSVLGEGGFGITYYGVDDLFGNEVAKKNFSRRELLRETTNIPIMLP